MNYVRRFEEIGAQDIDAVGGKGANLGELRRAGLPVPPGFCISAEAYREFVRTSGAEGTIQRALAGLAPEDSEQLEARTAQIRDFLTAHVVPPAIAEPILASYRELGAELHKNAEGVVPVAVRSSATAEDLPTASFAGQQDTYLNVRGDEALLEFVKRCWASLWTARAVAYRVKQGFSHVQVALAVVVQAMIQSEVSGIMFTANPVTQARDEIVVNASWGLGEAIVSGQVTPDTYLVRKNDGAILEREIANKDRQIEYAPGGGTVEKEVPPAQRELPALSDSQIAELVALGLKIEAHYGAPMDVEWAYAHGTFYMLQARAITTLDGANGDDATEGGAGAGRTDSSPAPKGEFNRTMFVEIFPDPLSPIFLSVIAPLFKSMLDFTFETLGFKPPRGIEGTHVFYNQPYFNRDYLQAALQPLSPPVRETLVAQIVNPFGRLEHSLRAEFSIPFIGMALRLLRFMNEFPSLLPRLVATYQNQVAAVAAVPLDTASDSEIVARMRNLVCGIAAHLLNYDFLLIALIGLTFQTLGTLLQRYFASETDTIRGQLLSGVTGNVTMETNQRIWDLAQLAKRSPEVSAALKRSTGAALQSELSRTVEGQTFLVALDEFLKQYGHREIRLDILYPTWGEDPAPVLAFVRGYLDVGDDSSPYWQQERLVKQRQELAVKVQRRLRRDLLGRWLFLPLFNRILADTQKHASERDTMHFELTRLFPPFRQQLCELGRRWTERGILDRPDDIFFLTLEELIALADKPESVQERVLVRRAEYEASKRRTAPGIIRDGQEIHAPAALSDQTVEGQLRGIAGSPGRVTGVARVICGPDEFDKLQSGDILVAPLTNPVWTPLFAIASGLVTEVGGILSHGAIVAREYGIPAVMAVPNATKILREGQRMTIDGNKGIVYLDS